MPFILNSKKRLIKIGIDGGDFVPFSPVKSGIQRIVDSFLKEISKLKNNNFIFNYYHFSAEDHPTGVVTYKRLPKEFFASLSLPLHFLMDGNDIFLGFSAYLPDLLAGFNGKKIVFLYDLGFLKYPSFYSNPKKLKNNLTRVIKSADRVITLSNYAENQIERYFSADEKKIVRLYPGLNHFAGKNLINQLIEFKYFLYVGVIKPIKNIEGLFRCFNRFLQLSSDKGYHLVLIGEREKEYFNSLLTSSDYKKIKSKVIFLGNVSDDKLIDYYLKAVALINFSYEEGFCFPVLEALSLGKIAVVNNLPIYNEFKPYFNNLLMGKNEREIVQLMIKVTEDSKKTFSNFKVIRRLGVDYLRRFSWNNFSKKLLEIIRQT